MVTVQFQQYPGICLEELGKITFSVVNYSHVGSAQVTYNWQCHRYENMQNVKHENILRYDIKVAVC